MRHLYKQLDEREEGFTLIELLVVVIIIGILAAIAIPVFLNQREKAWDAAAKSDVRNAQTAAETHYTDNTTYAGIANADLVAAGFTSSANVTTAICGTLNGYLVGAKHASSDNVFYFSSDTGQLTGPVTVAVYNALATTAGTIPCDSTDL